MNINIPLVSICCQTFNHKDFIAIAIDSFLMQKTSFEFEILLRDDASTDGTAEICHKYANEYPDFIKLLAYDENQFQKGISPFRDNVKRAQGKYIALCEGDDYWTDPLKLQKQFDFLEGNSEYSMCFHNVSILNMNGKFEKNFISHERNDFTIEDIVNFDTWFIPTGSIFYLNNFSMPIPDQKIIGGDVLLCSILAHQGKLRLIDDTMAVYRKHEGGLTYNKNKENWLYNVVYRINFLDSYFDYQYHKLYKKELYNTFGKLALSNSHLGKLSTFYFLLLSFFKISNFKDFTYFFKYYFKNSCINFINFILNRKQ